METDAGDVPLAVVVVAASAGGVEALTEFVAALPADFPAAVLVVLHVSDAGPSVLPDILSRSGALPAVHATDDVPIRPGRLLVAPPGQHLRVRDGRAQLDPGPRENGHRPSADALFRSAAVAFDGRAAGVVLSGTMDDGAAGLHAIAMAGGFTVVQDPAEAAFPGMPRAAIAEGPPDVVCEASEMAGHLMAWLDKLSEGPLDQMAALAPVGAREDPAMDNVSPFTCPECGGSLWVEASHGRDRFRCRVGHTFSSQGLALGKHTAIEAALWAAIVALQERADLSQRLVRRLEVSGRRTQLSRYRDDIARATDHVTVLRGVLDELMQQHPVPDDGDEDVTPAAR